MTSCPRTWWTTAYGRWCRASTSSYVPVQHQLLVVNLMCYFDDIFLSYVQHNSLPAVFQLIEDWWERRAEAAGMGQ